MRVDYFHTGGPKSGETFALDRVVNDGRWPGSRTQLVDATNLGPYRFEVRDVASGALLYSRGFASIYGEWETTGEAPKLHRTFHESVRFPWPLAPVRVTIQKRNAANAFADVWTTEVDPASRFVNSGSPAPRGNVWNVIDSGPPERKVDLLVLGEGYTQAEMAKFHGDVKRLVDALFAQEPFRSRRGDFNVRAMDIASAASGVNRPNAGVFRRTPLSAEYNIFDSERYVLTLDNRTLRDTASAAPYEFIEILVNERTYGGGGIFNDQATASVDSAFSEYVFVHEFGHHFAALADEYYTSDVAYDTSAAPKLEPWEPNVTALLDPAIAEMGRSRHAGHAPADALAEGGVREALDGDPGAPAGDPQAQRARVRDGRALPRTAGVRGEAPEKRAARQRRRRLRRRQLPGAGALPLAGRLHHVHAQPGGFLRGVPAGDQPDHRSVFEMIAARQRHDAVTPTIGAGPPK